MTREDAIRRVQALIRLAESTTFPDEAVQARRKAAFLTDQHKLSAKDFEPVVIPLRRPRPPAPAPPPPVQNWSWSTSTTAAYGTFYNGGSRIRIKFADGQIYEVIL